MQLYPKIRQTKVIVMAFKLHKDYFLFSLMVVVVGAENNKTFDNRQGLTFSCDSLKEWKTLEIHGKTIKDACVKSDYYAIDAPGNQRNTQVSIVVREVKVVNVNELTKTMTIDITATAIWEDDRIMVNYHRNKTYIDFPQVTKGAIPEVWTPFETMTIPNMKNRGYVLDPITMYLGLARSDITMKVFELDNIFPNNISMSFSSISWRFTVSCPFDFSKFPFDNNTCPFRIEFWNMNITWQLQRTFIETKEGADQRMSSNGFDIKTILVPPQIFGDPNTDIHHLTSVGFDIDMTRRTSKYIYQYYLTSYAIVTSASFSFIIPFSAIPGRVALLVTQFLTLTNIFINLMVSTKEPMI